MRQPGKPASKTPLLVDYVLRTMPFPPALLGFLEDLPDDSAPEEHATAQQQARAVEPPRKKARRNAESVSDHVPIAEESFDIERPCWPQLLKSQPRLAFTKPQANRCMQLHCTLPAYTPGEHAIATELIISGQHRSRIKSTLALYSLVSPKAACILRVASRSRDNQETEGGVWVAFDIGLERKDGTDRISLRLQLMWNPTRSVYTCIRSAHQRALCQEIADNFFPPDMLSGTSQYGPSPQAFYDATCAPDADYTDLLSVPVPMLVSELYPFQQRALQWLLEREGVRWSQGQLVPYSKEASSDLPFSFHRIHSTDSRPAYASTVYHVVTRDLHPFWEMETSFRGGILSEEMGLGKTVEMIALMLMHRRPPHPPFVLDHHSGNQVRPTGATLIVTPTNLKNQWLSEMDKHAPGMRVTYYGGIKQHSSGGDELVKELAEHDVVVTTYSVLQAEIHFAVEPPKRAMRHERKHPRPMSPLVQLSWWRVCLDEAQQIESGVSAAAKVARTIPRVNAWGVTGTPVKDNVKDLWGLLLFLRYEPFASHPWTWDTLASTHGHMFRALFNRIAMRHTKRAVRNELVLPPQKRFILTMPFTAVEEQNYKTQFGTLAQGCGLDTTGAPLVRNWNPDDPTTLDSMRRALAQLRQTVLHPELGPGRIRGMTQRNKPLRTIDEVLDAMIEQTEYAIKADQRQGLNNKIRRGQLFENSPRVKEALAIWEEALEEAKLLVAECREQLKEETEKAREDGAENIREDGDDDAQDVPPRLGEARRRLKLALGIEHKAIFFIASAYFQIKTDEDMTPPDSNEFKRLEKLEAEGYELAKGIRKEILRDVHAKAERYMSRLSEDAETQSFVEIPEFKSVPHKALEGRNILDNLEKLGAILDEQANMIDGWRERVVQLLLRPLVDEEGEAEITGEEYGDSTMIQDELMIYTLVLRAAIADRQDALSGLKNERVKHETRSAELLAKEGEGPAPETLLELLQLRRDMKPSPGHGSFRSVITNLRELATKLRHDVANGSNRAAIELEIIQQHLKLTQEHIAKQTKAANGLEKELDRFSDAMNTRIEYYRQLQQVSDTVAPWEREEDGDMDAAHLSDLLATEKAIQQRITSAQSKYRYLLSLKKSGENRQEPKLCVICQSNFTLGVLTLCGHQFCKECIMLWYRAHRNCPVCKKQLTSEMLHDISLKPESKLKVVSENHASSTNADLSHHVARRSGIYSEFSEDKLQEIRKVELDGPSFGTKVDMLIRHLMWLRQEDPGAKSIVFSQFKSFLDILGRAFRHYRVGYSTFDSKDGITRFKDDPSIECFLMDARAHASGLNLVNASHVFLCEPLLNTALELQAIARVDRIGQEHDTTVWLYLVEGTVEESIYNLSVQRRMEHMAQSPTTSKKGKSKEATPDVSDLNLEAANSMELQQAALNKLMSKDQQLGEVVDKNDVWECLFGHLAAETRDQTTSTKMDERFDDPAVVGFLAGEAAAARRDGASRA